MLMFTMLRKRYWEYRQSHSVNKCAPIEQKIYYYVNWYYYTHNVVMPDAVRELLDRVCYSVSRGYIPSAYTSITDEAEFIDELCLQEFGIPKNWNDEY